MGHTIHALPSIGRIVHYTNLGDKDGKYPPEVQAAMVVGVYRRVNSDADHNDTTQLVASNGVGEGTNSYFVDLLVFYRTGDFRCQKVPFSPEPARGCWNWPPRTV